MRAYLSIKCPICHGINNDIITCQSCGNSFCKGCAEKENTKRKECPSCKFKDFELIKNKGIAQILKDSVKKCDFCHATLNINEFEDHKDNCKIYSCNFCERKFYDEDSFYNHYSKDQTHKDIVVFFFDKKKMNEKIPTSLEENIKKLKEITKKTEFLEKLLEEAEKNEPEKKGKIYEDSKEIHPYLNLVHNNKNQQSDLVNVNDEYSQIRNSIDKPSDVTLNQFMDLYYCGCQTNFQCEYNICAPGSFLCPRCMRLNQKYHGLKRHYLINSAGRVSRCIRGKFQCNCEYLKIIKSQGNTFMNKNNCNSDFLCDACYELNNNDILKQYIPEEFLYKVLNN